MILTYPLPVAIFLGIIWFALMAAVFFGTVFAAVAVVENGGPRRWWSAALRALAGAAALAGVISLPFTLGLMPPSSDGSEHCGPGTVYHSATHLVGKTVVTEWQCDPR